MPYSIRRSLKRLSGKTDKAKIQKEMSVLGLELGELQSKVKEYKDYTDDIVKAKKELQEIRDEQKQEVKNLKDEIILLSSIKLAGFCLQHLIYILLKVMYKSHLYDIR